MWNMAKPSVHETTVKVNEIECITSNVQNGRKSGTIDPKTTATNHATIFINLSVHKVEENRLHVCN